MSPLLIFLLSLYQLQTTTFSAVVDTPRYGLNAITADNDDDLNALLPPEVDDGDVNSVINNNSEESTESERSETIPFVKSGHDQTEVEFRHPISSVNIDYSKNVIVLKFRSKHPKLHSKYVSDEDEQKRKSLENNFMRFGRSSADFMRFGKRQIEELPEVNSIDRGWTKYDKVPARTVERIERSHEGVRDSRGDNFMRFGRAPADFMRFGRSHPADYMRFGRNPSDFMRLGRGGPDDFMRFGRTPTNKDFLRFGRNQKVPRTTDTNFIRFGRPDNFMRFGRTPSSDTTDKAANYMRFGKMDQNFMRFGKSAPSSSSSSSSVQQADKGNHTKALLQKSDIKEAAKLLRQSEKDATDESNPMDKAIKVLFSKQQHQNRDEQQRPRSSEEADNAQNDDLDLAPDYGYNVLN